MDTNHASAGRERRRHPRYDIRKAVRIVGGDGFYNGTLRDISVGGAAVELRGPISDHSEVKVEIEELGDYPAEVVRRIDENVIALRFTINEAMAVRLAARIAVAHLASEDTSGVSFESIEMLPNAT